MRAAAFPANDLLRGLSQDGTGYQHGDRGNNATDNRDQEFPSLDASDDADHAISGVLYRSDVRHEIFGDTHTIHHVHDHSPFGLSDQQTTPRQFGKRFRAAPCVAPGQSFRVLVSLLRFVFSGVGRAFTFWQSDGGRHRNAGTLES
jgi:hypothetical protein